MNGDSEQDIWLWTLPSARHEQTTYFEQLQLTTIPRYMMLEPLQRPVLQKGGRFSDPS